MFLRQSFQLITVILVAGLAQFSWAQFPSTNPQNAVVVVNPGTTIDPYRVAPAGFNGPWLGNGGLFPNMHNPNDVNRWWFRSEYLYWFPDGMDTPPLVTTSPAGTPQNRAGILGEAGTGIIFGGGELNDDGYSGFRQRAGFWITPQREIGIEGEYFQLFGKGDSFSGNGNGAPILARPFFDVVNDRETAQLFSFPGLANGSLQINTDTDLRSALLTARASLSPVYCNTCSPYEETDRIDWIVGYRYLDLQDSIGFQETIDSQVVGAPGTIVLNESFETKNRFNGLQLGIVHQANFRRAWLESMLRIAVGSNTQRVNIAGNTAITELGVTDNFPGGLYAQTSNIGSYKRSDFTMIPEISVTFGFRVTDQVSVTVGYSILYFPNVVRAGDQIDTSINPNLIPEPIIPVTGSQRPQFSFVESDYWIHGLSVGSEFRF